MNCPHYIKIKNNKVVEVHYPTPSQDLDLLKKNGYVLCDGKIRMSVYLSEYDGDYSLEVEGRCDLCKREVSGLSISLDDMLTDYVAKL